MEIKQAGYVLVASNDIMNKQISKILTSILFLSAVFFSGCGGGSSSSVPTTEKTGIFLDTYVKGIRYISTGPNGEKYEGTTETSSEFKFYTGGTVEFYIGNIRLGSGSGSEIMTVADISSTTTEQTNILRFIQTLDEDGDPSNGIVISDVVIGAILTKNTMLDFKSSDFDQQYNDLAQAFQYTTIANRPLVDGTQALAHSETSARIAAIAELGLGKVLSNNLNYSANYYNREALLASQKKRVYLWTWENMLGKIFDMETAMVTDHIKTTEETHDFLQKGLDYADALVSITSAGKGAYDLAKSAGTRTLRYETAIAAGAGISTCSAGVKAYNATGTEIGSFEPAEMCKMVALSGVNIQGSDALATGLMSDFISKAISTITKAVVMNTNILSGGEISMKKVPFDALDRASMAISIAKIANDTTGAYKVSTTMTDVNSRMIAKMWLSAHFRSAFDPASKSKLITESSDTSLLAMDKQIQYLANKYASSGALCDAWKILNPFSTCDNTPNYNFELTKSIIQTYLNRADSLYQQINTNVGGISDGNVEIGLFDIGPILGITGNYKAYASSNGMTNTVILNITQVDSNVAGTYTETLNSDWCGPVIANGIVSGTQSNIILKQTSAVQKCTGNGQYDGYWLETPVNGYERNLSVNYNGSLDVTSSECQLTYNNTCVANFIRFDQI